MKLSIIIPVYNVEKYIEDCILSCVENIGENSYEIEVIIVNDGSKDYSISIAQSLIAGYPYCRIISQENRGLSMARNNGLEVAKGDYVWFIDSDDFISIGVVHEIVSMIDKYVNLDIIELNYEKTEEDVIRADCPKFFNNETAIDIITGRERIVNGFHSPVQFHVFRREYLNENSFRMFPGIYHEDGEFTPRVLWKAQRVAVLKGVAYYYRQRRNSIMTTVNPKKGEDNILVSRHLYDFFIGEQLDSKESGAVNNFISMAFCNGLSNTVGAKRKDKKRIQKAAYKNRIILNSLKSSTKIKYRILGFLSTFCPHMIVSIYLLMRKFK